MLKTLKAVQKRVKISKKGKLKRRPLKQNHFRAKMPARKKQDKRRWLDFSSVDEKKIRRYIPYL